LPQLEEIILMLNADDAGAAATHKHAHVLQALLPHLHITCVQLPAGEDVNSLLQSHDDPKILSDIIEQRTNFSFSIEKEKLEIIAGSSQQSKLNTSNNELLIYH